MWNQFFSPQPLADLPKISHHKVDFVCNIVNAGVVLRILDFQRVKINGNDVIAGHGQLDGVAADSTAGIHHHIALSAEAEGKRRPAADVTWVETNFLILVQSTHRAAPGMMLGYALHRCRKPGFRIHLDA